MEQFGFVNIAVDIYVKINTVMPMFKKISRLIKQTKRSNKTERTIYLFICLFLVFR